jgi:DNA invertase Pin-like site-specific DNA recombinase
MVKFVVVYDKDDDILACGSVKEVAKTLDLNTSTVYRRLGKEEYYNGMYFYELEEGEDDNYE